MTLKILADDMMPLVEELFSPLAEIKKCPGRQITAKDVEDADALLCRSITQVDAALLANSRVRFVGSATIGVDHLDTQWLESQGIEWTNAAGCNAAAVAQYVLSATAWWCLGQGRDMRQLTIGIVGVGNVGSCLENYCRHLGVQTRLCDPPLQRAGVKKNFQPLTALMDCDVLTFHVPLTDQGEDATRYLVNHRLLSNLGQDQLLINASRGGVVDKSALLDALSDSRMPAMVLDVFPDEPAVDKRLLHHCLLATPHIAGHTLEGKIRGSWMVYRAFCQHFGLPVTIDESSIYPAPTPFQLKGQSLEQQLLTLYPINRDSDRLKRLTTQGKAQHLSAKDFDGLRKAYLRVEGPNWRRDYPWCQARLDADELLSDLLAG